MQVNSGDASTLPLVRRWGGPESRGAGSVLGPGAHGTACSASEASEPGTPRHPCVPVPLVAPDSSPGCEVSELCQTRDWPQVGGPYAPSGRVWGSHSRCSVPNTDSWFLAQASAFWTGRVGYIELLERKGGRGHQPVPSTRALRVDTEAPGGRPFCAGEELSSAVHGGRDTGPGPLGWGDTCLHAPHSSASNASRSWRPGRLPRSQKPAVVTVCCPCHTPVTLTSSGQEGGCSATVRYTGQRPAELPRAPRPAAGSAGLRRWKGRTARAQGGAGAGPARPRSEGPH